MLKIVDYAKRCEMEWYEVMRQSIDEPSVTPVAILNHGELIVYELDENELMGDYPGTEPIALAYEECALNPAFMARLVHARFPVIFYPVTKKEDGFATDFYQLDDMPLRPEAVSKYEGMDRVWFGFSKQVSITLDEIWVPGDFQSASQFLSDKEPEAEVKHRKQITPHSKFIAHQIRHGKVMLNSWQLFKRLASESRGAEHVDLPGFGPIYLKQHPKDIAGTILYSDTVFGSPTDGKVVKKNAFDRAWNRIRGQK